MWLGGIDVDDFDGSFVAVAASIEGVTAMSPVQGFPQGGAIGEPNFLPYPDADMIADAHQRGLEVIPWTVNVSGDDGLLHRSWRRRHHH